MVSVKTIKTYSIPVKEFTYEEFCTFVSDFGISLGHHNLKEIYRMADQWPYLEWSKEVMMWSLYEKPTMEILISHETAKVGYEGILPLYVEAVNKIDDYFEYRNDSVTDKRFVREVLKDLTKSLSELRG